MTRVALVSTYPPAECGIGNYTSQLVGALTAAAPDIEVSLLAERVDRAADPPSVRRVWDRHGDWVGELATAIVSVRPDVVHVQHEEAIFGQDRRLPTLLAELQARGIRTLVTLHSVYDRRFTLPIPGWVPGRSFHRRLAPTCDRIVVHQRAGMADVLSSHGVADDRIVIIPHGTPHMTLPDRAAARETLELPASGPIAMFFGFIHRRKGLHVAIEAFEAARVPGASLVITGRLRSGSGSDRRYAALLERLMRDGRDAGRIVYRPGFVPNDRKPAYFAAADLIVLPHDQMYGSASGVLHEALAARRAILCTHGKKFAEASERFAAAAPDAFPAAGDVAAWQRGFARLLGDEALRARNTALVGSLAEETSWTVSAARHAAVYREVASGRH